MLTTSAPTIPDPEALPDLPFEILDSPIVPHALTVTVPTHADPLTPADLLAQPDGFLRWLAGFPGSHEIGTACTSGECPLWRYLDAQGIETVVGHDHVCWGDTHQEPYPLPAWAARFVRLVDVCGHVGIRASHAIALVHQAVRDTRIEARS